MNHHIHMRNAPTFSREQPVLPRTADHALRALIVLARHGVGQSLSAVRICELTGTPRNYTGKTLHALARAGFLRSTRGPTGGFALLRQPSAITLADIADVFAESPRAPQCLLGTGPCDPEHPCAAHAQWMRVAAAARAPLKTTTIADLLYVSPLAEDLS